MRKLKSNYLFFSSLLFVVLFIFTGCNTSQKQPERPEYYKQLGKAVTDSIQSLLIQNVGNQINTGGILQAISYCNAKALPLTQSLSQEYNIVLERLAEKNRNPINNLKTSLDQEIWNKIIDFPEGMVAKDKEGKHYYYRPIKIGMESCLQCHGKKEQLVSKVRDTISFYYPEDKAVDFAIGDLRGMWKISFE